MTIDEIAGLLVKLGCPSYKCRDMAAQLRRRALMDADRKGTSFEAELQRLIGLMAQGWSATGKPEGH